MLLPVTLSNTMSVLITTRSRVDVYRTQLHVRLHIAPALGHLKLTSLTTPRIR
jgi:hypothetical protein